MNIVGNKIKLKLFGTSHGKQVGCVIYGLPKGITLNWTLIKKEMARRKPGFSSITSQRKEEDEPIIISGIKNNITDGKPLKMIIKNNNVKSNDYTTLLRPGHADWTQYTKYGHVLPGGGQFSGRLTAPVVFMGAICKQLLARNKITIESRISSIGKIYDPTLEQIDKVINKTREMNDSIGGVVEATAKNIPSSLGSDFFGGIEAKVANLLFSIPGVKGVEFGDGFKMSYANGSQTNDEIYIKNKKIYSKTNHMGGILGGISNGMPIIVRVGFKPTPSIGIAQNTVNILNMKQEKITISGRHDPCIAIRGQIVVEAYLAFAILDLLLEEK